MPFPYPKNTLHSPRVRGRLSGLQLPFESGNPVFQFSNLFLHVSELCIPTQHNDLQTPPRLKMLSTLGKAWQGGSVAMLAGCYRKITARSGGPPRTVQSAPLFRGRLA